MSIESMLLYFKTSNNEINTIISMKNELKVNNRNKKNEKWLKQQIGKRIKR